MSAKGKTGKRKGAPPQDGSVSDGPPHKKGDTRSPTNATLPVTPAKKLLVVSLTCEVDEGGCGKIFSNSRWLARHHSKAEGE
jgi:hypothetical protein